MLTIYYKSNYWLYITTVTISFETGESKYIALQIKKSYKLEYNTSVF